MITISWRISVQDAGGKPAGSLKIDLQYFALDADAWTTVATAASDNSGLAAGRAQLDAGAQLPSLRVVLTGSNNVLANAPGAIALQKVAGRGAVADLDFGAVTLLEQVLRSKTAGHERVAVESVLVEQARKQYVASAEYKSMQTDLEHKTVQIGDLQNQLASVQNRAAASQRDLQQQLERKSDEVGKLQQQLQTSVDVAQREKREISDQLTRQLDEKNTEIQNWQQQFASLEEEAKIQQKNLRAELADSELKQQGLQEQLKQTEIQLEQASAKAASGEKAAKDAPVARRTVGIANLIDTLGKDMHQAAQTLTLDKSSFSLANVRIQAKGRLVAGEDGELQFMPAAEGDDAQGLSSADMSFEADATEAPVLEVPVPDVQGLTPSAARRVLSSLGLRLQVSQGPAAIKKGSVPGQAMLQTPAAGAAAARGASVTVVFAQ